jgi:hypothetical protein
MSPGAGVDRVTLHFADLPSCRPPRLGANGDATPEYGRAESLSSAGRPYEARAELGRAVEMLREMEMAHWLPEAEAELAAASST